MMFNMLHASLYSSSGKSFGVSKKHLHEKDHHHTHIVSLLFNTNSINETSINASTRQQISKLTVVCLVGLQL